MRIGFHRKFPDAEIPQALTLYGEMGVDEIDLLMSETDADVNWSADESHARPVPAPDSLACASNVRLICVMLSSNAVGHIISVGLRAIWQDPVADAPTGRSE